MLAMPWIVTGDFIYQSFIAESKLWGSYIIPQSFMIYSATSIFTLIASGFLVDKFTSRKLIPLMNLPLLFGLIVLMYYFGLMIAPWSEEKYGKDGSSSGQILGDILGKVFKSKAKKNKTSKKKEKK